MESVRSAEQNPPDGYIDRNAWQPTRETSPAEDYERFPREPLRSPDDVDLDNTGFTLGFFGGYASFGDAAYADDEEITLEDGALAGINLGWDFGAIRFEYQSLLTYSEPEELDERRFDEDPPPSLGHVLTGVETLNLLVDIPVTRRVEIYVGGGVGVAGVLIDVENLGTSADDYETGLAFAWNASAGVAVKLSRHAALTVGGRYFDVAEVDIAGGTYDPDPSVAVEAGLRFTF
ncbi:hypothetical protein PSMK_19950 [Phycisphaera mikurensis NBRC 102666]|uniref:Outer membrane protein beta-barrel domain-containing protein n=1 Tax=Phycisphaera mikurensis (strain NBRC 102666 / KCTC 22515 / FYK2301M01) TaxID=1142394 RepID=I0IFW6_PHYMF|nr:hypothetical protein PSMK_19950 [Phycisphaera mikurensis NBRC 102666]